MSQLLLDIAPEWQPTLDNFVTGRNAELVAALRQALAGGAERSFYLWGEEGSGKSHLLQACVRAARESGGAAVYACASVPPPAEVVAVDDVGRLGDDAQVELFDLFNRMRDGGGLLLVSGTQSPLHMALRDDLRTRLGWGLIYHVQGLSDDEKIKALEHHAQSRGFVLPLEVTQYLLRYGRRDLSSLVAALDALDEQSLRMQRVPTVPMLRELLRHGLETDGGD